MIDDRDGSPITMASLAVTAKVSRRTLTTHWPSMEVLLTEALMESTSFALADPSLPVVDRLRTFLTSVRGSISDPITYTVVLTTAAAEKSKQHPRQDAEIYLITRGMVETFGAAVAPLSAEQYAILVGPILFAELFTTSAASEEMIEDLVVIGMAMIDRLPA